MNKQIQNDLDKGQTDQASQIAFQIIFALNSLKNTGDEKAAPLISPILEQIATLIGQLRNHDVNGAKQCNINIKNLLEQLIEVIGGAGGGAGGKLLNE